VISDLVLPGHDCARQRRVAIDALADAEEGRPRLVLIEQVDPARRRS